MKRGLDLLTCMAVVASAVVLAVGPAKAGPDFTGVCPNVVGAGPFGGGGVGSAAGCTIGITIVPTSSTLVINTAASPGSTTGLVTSTAGPPTAYEGNEDVLVGIANTSTATISSVTLSGSGIFGFDGDGIDLYAGIPNNSKDTTGYGGPISFFTGINPALDSGQVNFIGGLAPGASTFFSLEAPVAGGLSGHVGGVPEPASMTLLGAGLLAIGIVRRRRRG